ncbi:hypothetical protein [Galbitalea soli]|uniref:Uncharacterized protein n=1 Tax=Galbitalea soli TaxID=1268042 RepID=A0A7C9PMF0_9MICO|nr:hypothetical protein [Galbitalea soli]NEM90786.1 hypothetical protein [Galbitalea soli]NYJ31504.1 hypothetical protein [Galbitalea soli]
MRHDQADAVAAAQRAAATYAPGWHPILAAVEAEPGLWFMMAQYGRCYGVIRQLQIAGERGYRAVTWAERSDERQLIGYFRTLRAACWATHQKFLSTHGQLGEPNGGGTFKGNRPPR